MNLNLFQFQKRSPCGSNAVVGKDVLKFLLILLLLFSASCATFVTKPLKLAVDLTFKPAKIITDATVDLVEKPVRKVVEIAKPRNPLKAFR